MKNEAGEDEEKEQEKLGKLEFSLDYNFTDTQASPLRDRTYDISMALLYTDEPQPCFL